MLLAGRCVWQPLTQFPGTKIGEQGCGTGSLSGVCIYRKQTITELWRKDEKLIIANLFFQSRVLWRRQGQRFAISSVR